MRYLLVFLLIALSFNSCKSSKSTHIVTKKTRTTKTTSSSRPKSNGQIASIIRHAESYKGVRYKFGGTTKKGMDCSGLVYVSFKEQGINLPRVSRDMAKKGRPIQLSEVRPGDLLFFQTNKNKRVINHVGLVVKQNNGAIQFIHATSSKGVITSYLSERYWNNSFKSARRLL